MIEESSRDNCLWSNLIVSESGSTINVNRTSITHFISSKITGQHPAPKGFEFAILDSRIYLKNLNGGDDKSCRNSFIDSDGNMPYFFGRGYFFSESDIHTMNMRRKLRAV